MKSANTFIKAYFRTRDIISVSYDKVYEQSSKKLLKTKTIQNLLEEFQYKDLIFYTE